MTNLTYLQNLPPDLFLAVLGGLMGVESFKNPEEANNWLWTWLQSDVDEDFSKAELREYCDLHDRYNSELAENRRLRAEISRLAQESVERDRELARLEAEVEAATD